MRALPAYDLDDGLARVLLPGGRMVVGPYSGPERFASDDAGATWQPLAGVAPDRLQLARDPQRTGRVWRIARRCAASSDDDARSWQRRICATRDASLLAPVADRGGRTAWLQVRFVAAGVRLARSRDGGRTWRRLPTLPRFTVPVGLDGSLVAVLRDGRVVRLGPNGRAWRPWSRGLPTRAGTYPRIAVLPSGRVAYAAVDGRLFQRALDAARWSLLPDAPPGVHTLIPTTRGLVVAGSGGIAILEST